jgi:hypothetical protein
MFLHQPHHLLVVDDDAIVDQLGGHTPIAVARPLCADLIDAFDKPHEAHRRGYLCEDWPPAFEVFLILARRAEPDVGW